MYKLLKEKGSNMNLVLENTETKASIVVGRLTMDILSILESKEGVYIGGDDELRLKDKWDMVIKDETAKEIAAKAMRMNKPVRDQRKIQEEMKAKEELKKKQNKEIDAMDVLLGLADYN